MQDYFRYFTYQIDDDLYGIRKDIAEIINADIESTEIFPLSSIIMTKKKEQMNSVLGNF